VTAQSESSQPGRPALTREIIVDAARQMVSTSGLAALSLRKLAAELGVTAPALYAHVRDKADLLKQLADAGFRELLGRYAEIDTDDPIERIRQQSLIYVDLAVADPGLFTVMFMFRPGPLNEPGVEAQLPVASEAFEQPARAIAEAIDAGSIDAGHDPFLTALTLWTVAHGLAQVMLLGVSADPDGRSRLEEAVLGATLRGLHYPPG